MSRPERIEYPGAYYHVMNRGRNRAKVFHDERYFTCFLDVLGDAAERFNLVIHAYCLMSNHYHLLVSTPEGNLQSAMRYIGSVYTQRHNRLKRTDGALFKGRYKAILIDSDEYLLHLSKYIHLNPLEAKMVSDLADYTWSSYPAYLKKVKGESWLAKEEVYDQLTGQRNRVKRYRAYVEEIELPDTVTNFYLKDRLPAVLGNKAFKDSVLEYKSESSKEVPRQDRLTSRIDLDDIVDGVAAYYGVDRASIIELRRGRGLKNIPRKVAMYIAQIKGGYKLTEIASYFGLSHYGGVGSAVHLIRKWIGEDNKVRKQVNSIVKRFDP